MSPIRNFFPIFASLILLAGCEPTGNIDYRGPLPQVSGDADSIKEQLKAQYSREELIEAKDQLKAEFNALSPDEQGLAKSFAKAWQNGDK